MSAIRSKQRRRVGQQTTRFTHKAFTSISRAFTDQARSDRLARRFMSMRKRLDQALAVVKVEPEVIDLATRHILCAEALTEALEQRARSSAGDRKLSTSHLLAAYARNVAEKLRRFPERPVAEQRLISKVYHEVNLGLVRRACQRGLVPWESAASALEESCEYESLLKRLSRAGRPGT